MDKFHFHKYRTITRDVLPSGRDAWNKVNIMITKKCSICDKKTYVISTADKNNYIERKSNNNVVA